MNNITLTATAAAVLLLALYLARRNSAQAQYAQYAQEPDAEPVYGWGEWTDQAMVDAVPVEGDSQTTGLLEATFVTFTPSTYTGTGTDPANEGANIRAFLDMLSYAEDTAGPDGYRTMFGGTLMDSLADHPRKFFTFTNSKGETLKTSAAGRYQFLSRTWDELRAKLGLQDFGPDSQDAGAIELIRQRGALNDVKAGRVVDAISKVRTIWASLPGAGYSQPERTIPKLLAAYQSSGGTILTA